MLLYWYSLTLCLGLLLALALPQRRLLILPVALLLVLFWFGISASSGQGAYFAALLAGYFASWSRCLHRELASQPKIAQGCRLTPSLIHQHGFHSRFA